MKECEQESGADLNPEKTEQYKTQGKPKEEVEMIDTGAIDYKGNTIKIPKKQNLHKLVGGIKVDFEEA